jgi:uncharacterized protein (DUF934 family)
MPVLIDTDKIISDPWHHYDGSAENIPRNSPCLLPIEEWIEHPAIWNDYASDLGVILTGPDEPGRLTGRLSELALVAFDFTEDKRGFRHAQELRVQMGFTGTIRAVGPILAEEVPLLASCGFDQFVLTDEKQAGAALRLLENTVET